VTTARGRTASSTRWLDRHHTDPYVHRAQAEGYRSRAAYKLTEIDDRYGFLKRGARVVDLGAAPGGWSQVAAERVGATAARPLVVALDRLDIEPIAGAVVLKKDFLDEDAAAAIAGALDGLASAGRRAPGGARDDAAADDDAAAIGSTARDAAAQDDASIGGTARDAAEDDDASISSTARDGVEDATRPSGSAAESGAGRLVSVVLSDLAAPTTGHRQTDHLRTMQLCEAALDFAEDVLAPGGTLLAKVFQGGTEGELLARLRARFKTVRHVKPGASRAASPELYVLATGFARKPSV
jgi:23S rRNA U2552 (ribose-2'-O)-methylase RlmE/FtsJ